LHLFAEVVVVEVWEIHVLGCEVSKRRRRRRKKDMGCEESVCCALIYICSSC
jgi:hypothetical protein